MPGHNLVPQGITCPDTCPPTGIRSSRSGNPFRILYGLVWLALGLGEMCLPWQAYAADFPLQVFSTRRTEIFYSNPQDLHLLARRLGIVQDGPQERGIMVKLAEKLDGMLAEIERVLQVTPLKPQTLTIRLLRDSFQVKQQQLALARRPPGKALASKHPLISFYDPEARSIYVSLTDVHLGVLAHEMTHFVLCESSPVRPGAAYQESLAQYMEKRFLTGRSPP
jgi:hypothetical protein